jgi:IMP dehydrogenase
MFRKAYQHYGLKGIKDLMLYTSTTKHAMKTIASFDNLYLVPGHSDVESRHDVDLTPCYLPDKLKTVFTNPLIASCMDTVVNAEVATIMRKSGGTAVLHRYMTIDDQVKEFLKIPEDLRYGVFCAIGATGDYFERCSKLWDVGCRFFCIDVAHGHHENVKRAIYKIQSNNSDVWIMSGNVADLDGFEFLASQESQFIRCGVAGGSVCETKTKTGFGLPTLETVVRCQQTTYDSLIIADGGIRDSGDIVKALACGADMVMLGSMLAGHRESPGEIVNNGDGHFKRFRGMASESAQKDWRGRVSVAEGREILVPLKECSLEQTVDTILKGIKSGLSYAGSTNLKDFSRNVKKVFA